MMGSAGMKRGCSVILFFAIVVVCGIVSVHGSLVVGVDYGTESFKVAMIQARNIDLVLNSQSGRKTWNAVGFDDNNERFFMDAGLRLALRKPNRVLLGPQNLIGRRIDHPLIEVLQRRHPLDLFESTVREGLVEIRLDQNTTFYPEEVTGMILETVQAMASANAHASVKDIVITVPPFFSEFERQGIIDAVKLAGMNPLMLMNEGVAVAQQWAISRDFPEEEQNVAFYDLGAGSLKVTLVGFKMLNDSSKNKPIPHLTVKAAAWDETVGGIEFDLCLADFIADLVNKKRPGEPDVKENQRVMMRIRKESRTIKEILSANQAYLLSIESLIGDFDFSTTITRQQFEDACAPIFAKVLGPLERAVSDSGLSVSDIHGIEIVGGASRIPKVQEILKTYFGRELDHHLNGDEAAVFGATFQAAVLSPGFKVPTEYRIKDITPYEVGMRIEPVESSVQEKQSEEGQEQEEQLQYTLFAKGKRLNTKRTVSFTMGTDFSIDLFYNGSDVPAGAPKPIRRYSFTGIPTIETLANLTGMPRINVGFQLNRNGIVEVIKAEAEVVVSVLEEVRPNKTANASTPKTTESSDNEKKTEDAQEKAPEAQSEEVKSEASPTPETEGSEATQAESKEAANTTEEAPVIREPTLKKRRIPLKYTWKASSIPPLSAEEFRASSNKLRHWNRKDQTRRETEEAKNSLESYIYATKERLYDDEFIRASKEEEREKLSSKLTEYGDWLYDEGDNAGVVEYRKRLRELKDLGDAIEFRLEEEKLRPEAVANLQLTIEAYRRIVANLTVLYNVTDEEIKEALDQSKADEEWLNSKVEEQKTKTILDEPAFTSTEVNLRAKSLQNTVSRLQRKPKRKPPTPSKSATPKPKAKAEASSEEETTQPKGEQPEEGTATHEAVPEDSGSKEATETETVHREEQEVETLQQEAENLQV